MEKYIKIFLALSDAVLGNACDELEAFVGTLNNIYIRQNIFFELIKCADLDDALKMEQRKDEYNSQIRDSQYFYLLFGKSAGRYAEEEFDVALEQFRASGAPKIYTYFKQLPEGESAEKEVLDFMERLDKQLGHYYNMFEHLDAVKLNLILELSQDTQVGSMMEFKDGQALLDKQPVLSLENVPLYCGNETLQQKKLRQKALNEEFAGLVVRLGQNPLEEGLMDKVGELGSERKTLQEEIHQMEMDMLEMCKETAQKRHLGMQLDWREKKAMELVDQGNYEGAKNLLRDARWDEEVRQDEEELELLQEVEKEKREKIRKYISGKRALISQIRATGLDRQSVKEITDIYENITQKAEKYQMELEVLAEYIDFLSRQNRQAEGLAAAERLQRYYENNSEVSDVERVKLLLNLGHFYLNAGNHDKAEQSFQAALEIEMPESSLVLSQVYRGAARSFRLMGKMEEAEKFLSEALEISAHLSEREPENDKLRSHWCKCMIDFAAMQDKKGKQQEAAGLLREVLQAAQRLAEKNFEDYGSLLVDAYGSLTSTLHKMKQMEEAESLYRKGMGILSRLSEKNPEAYEVRMSVFCDNMAAFLEEVNKDEEAEGLYRMVRTINFRLFSKNPGDYKKTIARGAYNLARVLRKQGQMTEALALYGEAQEIYRELCKEKPEIYEGKMAEVCFIQAQCFSMQARHAITKSNRISSYSQANALYAEVEDMLDSYRKANLYDDIEMAENCCRNSLLICRRLWEQSPGAYEGELAKRCHLLGKLLFQKGSYEEAEKLYGEALEIYERLMEGNPMAYEKALTSTYQDFAMLLYRVGRDEEAEKLIQESVKANARFIDFNNAKEVRIDAMGGALILDMEQFKN